MKSNIANLYHGCIDGYMNNGSFKIDELIDNDIMPSLEIKSGGDYERLLRDSVKSTVSTMLNMSDCYCTGNKGEYVWLEKATLQQLNIIEKRERDSIRKKEKRLDHISSKLQGQLTFIFQENIIIGTKEENSLSAM